MTLIFTNRLFIRPLIPEDISDIYIKNLNDAEYMRFMDFHNHWTKESITDYIIKSNKGDIQKLFSIFAYPALSKHLGNIRLTSLDNESKSIELGILIFKEYSNRGIGKEALIAICDEIFGTGIQSVSAGVDAENTPSLLLFIRAGFKITKCFNYRRKQDGEERASIRFTKHNSE